MHRDIDVVAASGLLAPQQRHQDAHQRHQGAGTIGDRNVRMGRFAVLTDVEAEHACECLHADVVARPQILGTMVAKSRDRSVDDARIALIDRVVVRCRDASSHRGGRPRP